MQQYNGVRSASAREIQTLTGHTPSKPYNHKANVENQKQIVKLAIEAKEKGMSYGKYEAQKYLSEHRLSRTKA